MRTKLLASLTICLVLLGSAAQALTSYGDFIGTDVDFKDVNESSTFGDPEPLFGAPTVTGNQLLFFPATFSASAGGAGGFDQTGSLLNATIESTNALTTIDTIILEEFGDALIVGAGTAATGTFAQMSGFVTVLATTAGTITPVNIGFNGVFTPSSSLDLVNNPGSTLWSAIATIDIASIVPNATVVELQFDNNLVAFSEASTSSLIQKKVVDGPAVVITVIPEPTTALLLGLGLTGLGLRARARRS